LFDFVQYSSCCSDLGDFGLQKFLVCLRFVVGVFLDFKLGGRLE
jgi:hypothetical protein